jgi:hypothetical protein
VAGAPLVTIFTRQERGDAGLLFIFRREPYDKLFQDWVQGPDNAVVGPPEMRHKDLEQHRARADGEREPFTGPR